jgi:hypothetical protein
MAKAFHSRSQSDLLQYYCPIMIVMEEVDREYTSTMLALDIYCSSSSSE